ncbi:MAG: GGDEF domain-containing protein [Coriobacteriia bacterium]|nr:GGDEF domain-containing protein [Coriobacteriia bacterium]
MNQSRIAKTISRGAVVSWREQPTQHDIEALRANVERVRLVIRVRWAIVAMLAGYSVVAASVYGMSTDPDVFIKNMTIPAIALIFVLMYNGFYQMTYRKVGNISFLNQAQLLFDIVVVTVLVYYSGGVYSWFSAMYLLFILESAFILPRRKDVWMLVVVSATLYGLVLFGEYLGWFPHVSLPFVVNDLAGNFTYVVVRYLWKVTLYAGAALVGMLMMKSIRQREHELRESSLFDELTGLFNRQYFYRVLSSEVERTQRNGRSLALVLADVDRLGDVNRTFGIDVGDEILVAIARRLREVGDADTGEGACKVNVACRFGGEELALVVPEMTRTEDGRAPMEDLALAIAEAFRQAVEKVRVSGVGVTASVGVAIAPRDGDSPDALIDAADRMLSLAAQEGGNVVRASWLMDGSADGDA